MEARRRSFNLSTLFILQLCLLVAFVSSYVVPNEPQLDERANANPAVGGDPEAGWRTMPDVQEATKYPDWVIDKATGAVLPLYQTANQDNKAIKRAVVTLSGKSRDCWGYWNSANNALYKAAAKDDSIKRSEVSIMAPCWWQEQDLKAGAAPNNSLIWGGTTDWISGRYNVGPHSISNFSSYKALDALVAHYTDRSIYPNLETVVLAGHSAGGQLTQRYAALRSTTDNDDRIQFWLANAGSFLWLTPDRPVQQPGCEGIDDFKYGLSGDHIPGYATHDYNTLGRDGIVARYRGRHVHYAQGLIDFDQGDTRCQAFTQGANHLERGANFIHMLEGMKGGFPETHSVDWIEGVAHSNSGMISSTAGLEKLFKLNVKAKGSATKRFTHHSPARNLRRMMMRQA